MPDVAVTDSSGLPLSPCSLASVLRKLDSSMCVAYSKINVHFDKILAILDWRMDTEDRMIFPLEVYLTFG